MQFPISDKSFLLRTDFSNDFAWTSFCRFMGQAIGDYRADFECVSNEDFSGATVEQIVEAASATEAGFVVVADGASMRGPEVTALAIDLWDVPGRTFRFIPSQAWSVENNLSLANMAFSEFADNVDPDRIFRGFEALG